jgi:hypothetical protein
MRKNEEPKRNRTGVLEYWRNGVLVKGPTTPMCRSVSLVLLNRFDFILIAHLASASESG